jgi:hypothetical protein
MLEYQQCNDCGHTSRLQTSSLYRLKTKDKSTKNVIFYTMKVKSNPEYDHNIMKGYTRSVNYLEI